MYFLNCVHLSLCCCDVNFLAGINNVSSRAGTDNYFPLIIFLAGSTDHLSIKCQKIGGKCKIWFPAAQHVFKCLGLFNKESKTQKYSVPKHIKQKKNKQKKAQNPHIWEANTTTSPEHASLCTLKLKHPCRPTRRNVHVWVERVFRLSRVPSADLYILIINLNALTCKQRFNRAPGQGGAHFNCST